MKILFWTYNADTYCCQCAEEQHGIEALENETARDYEGNIPCPVFSTGEFDDYMPVCGTCLKELI